MLTPEDIDRIAAEGETFDVEFKGEVSGKISDGDMVEAVVCLANGSGGLLLVGVDDDGRVTGARARHEGGVISTGRLEAMLSNRTRPSLTVEAEVVDHPQGRVIAVKVPKARVAVACSNGRYLKRVLTGKGEPGCVPYFAYEMAGSERGAGVQDQTQQIIRGAGWDDLEPIEFERMRRFVRESRGRGDDELINLSDQDLAKALGAVEADGSVSGVRLIGLLLFGRESALAELLPTHEAAFQDMVGTQVGVNDFFRWPLLRLFEELSARFTHRNRRKEALVGMIRLEIPDYSEPGFREALANALVHRDYTRMGAVHVQFDEEHVRIDNPGGFPEGVRLDNLLVTPPRPRNPLLADAFKRAGLVERTGRGIDKIFEGQLLYGRPVPSYSLTTESSVTVILHGGEANLEFARFVVEEGRRGEALKLAQLLILNELYMQRATNVRRAAELIQKDEAEARRQLSRLVERGLLEARGPGRGADYHLSARVYRELGMEAAYVRARSFEPIQQEQMILQFVDSHGKITRREAAELCRINARQAGHLLQRLVGRGHLRLAGSGRNSHYVK